MAKVKLSDEEVAGFAAKYASFPEWEAALEERVAGLRGDGLDGGAVALETERERAAFYSARSAAFIRATQGKGKPLSKQSHGTGKKPGEK